MAISLNGTVVVGTVDTGDVTLSNVTCTAGDTILVGLAVREETDTFTVTDDDSNTYTKRREDDDDQCSTQMFSAVASQTGPIEITVDASAASAPIVAFAQAFTGVDTTTNDGVEANNGATSTPSDDDDMLASVTTVTANAWVVGVGTSRSQTLTVPGGETEISINQTAGSGGNITKGHLWYEGPVATPASTQLGATADLSGDIDWALSLVVLKPASAGGGQSVPVLSYHQRSVYV